MKIEIMASIFDIRKFNLIMIMNLNLFFLYNEDFD